MSDEFNQVIILQKGQKPSYLTRKGEKPYFLEGCTPNFIQLKTYYKRDGNGEYISLGAFFETYCIEHYDGPHHGSGTERGYIFSNENVRDDCFHMTFYEKVTLEDLKRHVFNLQGSGSSEDLKQSTPTGCGFKSSPE